MKAVYSLAWEVDPFASILDTFDGVTFTKSNAKKGFGPEIENAAIIARTAALTNTADE